MVRVSSSGEGESEVNKRPLWQPLSYHFQLSFTRIFRQLAVILDHVVSDIQATERLPASPLSPLTRHYCSLLLIQFYMRQKPHRSSTTRAVEHCSDDTQLIDP